MGEEAALLLVSRWACAILLVLAACQGSVPERVEAERYREFFLWAGVKPQPVLDRARTVYLLAGEVRRSGGFVPLRATPRVRQAEVWLVVRTQRLDWEDTIHADLAAELARWRSAGNRLAGIQIDFDASSKGLERYGAFLKDLRARLPGQYRLSITGLMDWSANADPAALAGLKGTVDEVVVQSYQGRETIPGYERYLDRLARVPVPHKVALVQGGTWREPAALRADPGFRGYVVFLLNP